ncbi:MAG: tetratricopeptide repeat protein [Pseudobdellovibrionaceae bacterium]
MLLLMVALASVVFMVVQNRRALQSLKEDQKIYRQARLYSGRPTNVAATLPTQRFANCSSFFEQVETLPLESLLFDLREGRMSLPANCEQDPLSAKMFTNLQQKCSPDSLAQSFADCETALFQYRTRRIQLWTQGQSLQELSTDLLIQRFYGMLFSGAANEAGGAEELRSLSEELKKRLPASAAPYRIEVVSYLAEPDLDAEKQLAFQNALREARARDPEDWQLFEMEWVQLAQSNPEAYAARVQEFLASQPNSPIGLYHAGCIAWKSGNQQAALESFQRASEQAPQDPRFSSTLQKSQSSKPGESICTSSLSFQFEDF